MWTQSLVPINLYVEFNPYPADHDYIVFFNLF